jgi:hypothetical protein
MNHGYRRGEETQTKSIDNLFNKIIAENFPNLEKVSNTQVQEVYRIPTIRTKKGNTHRHTIVKTFNIQNKEY